MKTLHRVLILIISAFCQVSRSQELFISPNSKQIVINEGETLNIACISKLIGSKSYDENKKILRESETWEAIYQYNISKENAVLSDTGWYCCADYNAFYMKNTTYEYPTEVNWLFVYVKPFITNKKFIVNENTIYLDASDYITKILCRQSTDVQPLLIKGNKLKMEKPLKNGSHVKFTFDFKYQRDDYYDCSIKAKQTQLFAYNTILFQRHVPIIQIHAETTFYVQKRSGDKVELGATVYEDGEKSFLQWFKPNGETIINSSNYYVRFVRYGNNMALFAFLQIIDTNVTDSGYYKLNARNIYSNVNQDFKLDVTGKPNCSLTLNESYYSLKQISEFHCKVISNPPSNVTWSFLRYPNYPLFTEKETVYLTNVTQEVAYNSSYKIKSMVKMLIEVSGQIKCEACNTLGCDSKNETILVSDGLGALGIIGPKESVIQGDNIELICAASVYNYTNDFTWTIRVNQTEKPVTQTDRLKLMQHRTPFTYRSTLKLNNVQRSDAQDYFCTVEFITPHQIIDSLPEHATSTYKLIIYDEIEPFFINTNMNRTDIRNIDMMTEDLDTVILQCFADGMPKPKVTWYKDNVTLKENDQYHFKYNYQELHIKYFLRHDSGTYSCRAINRAGTNETYQQITVKYTKYDTLELILVTSIPILSFILVILTIFITIKICREKKRRRKPDLMHFDGVTSEYINPNLTVKHLAKFLPYDEKWEFPIERLNLKEKLDNGYFGVVMKAEALGICRNESVTTVAVKMIRQSDKQIYIHALLSELKIMLHLGKHLNVVNLLGACTKNVLKGELLMIIEYCHFGNLHKYLLSHRYNFINQINSKTGELDHTIGADILKTVNVGNDSSNYEDQNFKPICTQDLISWSFQVARGMEYLSQKKVLHGDLAARNILLAKDNVVKICDFGLAKNMDEDYYKKKDSAPVPIKWMAIESIGHRIFTTQSDVWSFGIMLWEFFTLAKKPYTGIEAEDLYQKLIEGYRMKQPNYAIREIYNIMLQCWETEPTSRPSFTKLVESIGNLLEESVKMYYISLNTPYIDINETNLNVNPGCSNDESEMCNPLQDHSHIEFLSPESNCEDTIELSPMLKHEEDAHLKPIKFTSTKQHLSDESKQ